MVDYISGGSTYNPKNSTTLKMAEQLLAVVHRFNREDYGLVMRVNFEQKFTASESDRILDLYEEIFGYGYEGSNV